MYSQIYDYFAEGRFMFDLFVIFDNSGEKNILCQEKANGELTSWIDIGTSKSYVLMPPNIF